MQRRLSAPPSRPPARKHDGVEGGRTQVVDKPANVLDGRLRLGTHLLHEDIDVPGIAADQIMGNFSFKDQ